jgi:hypothetical protein
VRSGDQERGVKGECGSVRESGSGVFFCAKGHGRWSGGEGGGDKSNNT